MGTRDSNHGALGSKHLESGVWSPTDAAAGISMMTQVASAGSIDPTTRLVREIMDRQLTLCGRSFPHNICTPTLSRRHEYRWVCGMVRRQSLRDVIFMCPTMKPRCSRHCVGTHPFVFGATRQRLQDLLLQRATGRLLF